MTLTEKIIKTFHKSKNVQQKRELQPILEKIEENGYNSDDVYASLGEDSAAIIPDPDESDLVLLTTDAITQSFIKSSPFAAGFSSIYVGIDDIMACGGIPLACSITLGFKEENAGHLILDGVLEGTKRFKVPLVRGHTATKAKNYTLTSTMIGKCDLDHFISIKNGENGDNVGLVWDPEGSPGKINPNYWNTILDKPTDLFYKKRKFIRKAKELNLIHSCKDIANGGVMGTAYQMIDYSNKGIQFDLDSIKAQFEKYNNIPYSLIDFLFVFLTSSFLITYPKNAEKKADSNQKHKDGPNLLELIKKSNMKMIEMGKVTEEKKFSLVEKDQEALVGM